MIDLAEPRVVQQLIYDAACPAGHPAAWTSTQYAVLRMDETGHIFETTSSFTTADFDCPECPVAA